jgi:hypothetical protein
LLGFGFEDFTKEVAVISEDAIEQKPAIKKRILVAILLALAAIGTHWLPGRTIVATQNQPGQQLAVAASDKMIAGPNSLLGDAVTDKTAAMLTVGTDLTQYHMDTDAVVDLAGSSRLLTDVAPLASDSIASSELASVGQASAVPEPRTAGLLLLAAAPVFIRRKGRDSVAV